MKVRAATTGDVDAVARLHADGILLTVHGDVLDREARARLQDERAALWSALLAEPPVGQRAFVLDDGHVAGFASVGPDPDSEADGRVFALFVERNLWGAGIGSRLLEASERQLQRHHAIAGLWVVEDNLRARGLYERRGWRTGGTDKHQDGVRFIWYSKRLATGMPLVTEQKRGASRRRPASSGRSHLGMLKDRRHGTRPDQPPGPYRAPHISPSQ